MMDNEVRARQLTLLTEYREMRDEIRAAWAQYYSPLVGIGLSGIAYSFYRAVTIAAEEWLFLIVPLLICAFCCFIVMLRSNIQHISNYLSKLEHLLRSECKDTMIYETAYAKKLWGSTYFLFLQSVMLLILISVHFYSTCRGYYFISELLRNKGHTTLLGKSVGWLYVIIIVLVTVSILAIAVLNIMRISSGKFHIEKIEGANGELG